MLQPCFGKEVVKHKHVGVYIYVLPWKYHWNKDPKKKKSWYTLVFKLKFAMKWMQIFYLFNTRVVDFSCIIKNKPSKSSNHKLSPKSN
jgi:hypothetical protein